MAACVRKNLLRIFFHFLRYSRVVIYPVKHGLMPYQAVFWLQYPVALHIISHVSSKIHIMNASHLIRKVKKLARCTESLANTKSSQSVRDNASIIQVTVDHHHWRLPIRQQIVPGRIVTFQVLIVFPGQHWAFEVVSPLDVDFVTSD